MAIMCGDLDRRGIGVGAVYTLAAGVRRAQPHGQWAKPKGGDDVPGNRDQAGDRVPLGPAEMACFCRKAIG